MVQLDVGLREDVALPVPDGDPEVVALEEDITDGVELVLGDSAWIPDTDTVALDDSDGVTLEDEVSDMDDDGEVEPEYEGVSYGDSEADRTSDGEGDSEGV